MTTHFLHKATVLVLNRNWQAVNVRTPAEAFCQMATAAAMGLAVDAEDMRPVFWADWQALPVRERDQGVSTPRGRIRVPTVIVLIHFARVPKTRLPFSPRSIWIRDGGICQYTGRSLKPSEGNIDHVIPRSRGGLTSWENCVLAHRGVNSRKADRLPHEVGLKLIRKPQVPREMPVTCLIKNPHGIADWHHFLV